MISSMAGEKNRLNFKVFQSLKPCLYTFHEEQPMWLREIVQKYFQLAYFSYNILNQAKIESMQLPLKLLEQEMR